MKMNVMLICLLYGLHVQYEDECYLDMSVVAYMYNMKMNVMLILSVVWLTCTI